MGTQEIGKALLPTPVISKALPAPAEASAVATVSTVQKAEAVPESDSAPPTVEAAAEFASEVNSVPQPEVKAESLPGLSRPLSPFPYVRKLLSTLYKCSETMFGNSLQNLGIGIEHQILTKFKLCEMQMFFQFQFLELSCQA